MHLNTINKLIEIPGYKTTVVLSMTAKEIHVRIEPHKRKPIVCGDCGEIHDKGYHGSEEVVAEDLSLGKRRLYLHIVKRQNCCPKTNRKPMEKVDWVYRVEDLETAPPLPIIHWPGAVTGVRRFQRGPEVEYLASRTKGLIIIAAGDSYYAVSPNQVNEFLSTYHALTELGAISPISSESVQPALILSEVFKIRAILWILISGGLLNISLLIWTLLVIPSRDLVSLGFTPTGVPHEGLDSVRLVLFPVLNTTAYLANLVLGLFLFRNQENRFLAYQLWTGSLLVAILFHIGMLFILT